MAEPIEYDILIDIQSALQGISINGGYFHNVDADSVSIDPADQVEALLGTTLNTPFFVVEVGTARQIQYFPSNRQLERIPINITAADDATQLDPLARLKSFERIGADIEKALLVDHTRGGRATDTRIVDKQMFIGVGGQRVLTAVQIEVKVYRTYGAPNG